ncbi:MAG TPA: AmmeMemoRadiSam system protein B, partial [bacterium]|nr:AmmeMemoRadiSam system protein B [bacterium]
MLLKIRKPAVAGMFYPAEPQVLKQDIQTYLSQVQDCALVPKAIIVPHAGYIYSGQVAAQAYAQVSTIKDKIKRVVLLGPSHRVGFRGAALTNARCYNTSLGDVFLDTTAHEVLAGLPKVVVFDQAHVPEHSLEVQLPFLQVVLHDFVLVPVVVGDARPEEVGEMLCRLWGGEETLIVISTDLSHFEDYASACAHDARTCRLVEDMAYDSFEHDDACGRVPLGGMLRAASQKGLRIKTLELKNSGDTAGTKDRVVG